MHVFVTVVVAMVVARMGWWLWRAGCRRGGGHREWERGDGVVVVLGDVRMSVGVMPVFVLRRNVTCARVVVVMAVVVVVVFVVMIMGAMSMLMSSMRMVVSIVRVVMSSMGVAVAPTTVVVASVAECVHSNQVDEKTKTTDGQQFSEPLHFTSFN